MAYVQTYANNAPIQVGDLVLCSKLMVEKRGKDGKPEMVMVRGEVVRPCEFTKFPADAVCVVLHDNTMYGFHTHDTQKLPRRNGGYTFIKPKNLRLMSRRKEGQSVFDPLPKKEKYEKRQRW